MNASANVRTSARKAIKSLGRAVPNKTDLDRILRKCLNDNQIKKIHQVIAEPLQSNPGAVKTRRSGSVSGEGEPMSADRRFGKDRVRPPRANRGDQADKAKEDVIDSIRSCSPPAL
jgi:hypothetical protein